MHGGIRKLICLRVLPRDNQGHPSFWNKNISKLDKINFIHSIPKQLIFHLNILNWRYLAVDEEAHERKFNISNRKIVFWNRQLYLDKYHQSIRVVFYKCIVYSYLYFFRGLKMAKYLSKPRPNNLTIIDSEDLLTLSTLMSHSYLIA